MIKEIFKTIILAVVQGVTEFLPVSSSGHIVFLGELFSIEEDSVVLSAVLHAGTLVSILVVYFRSIIRILSRDHRTILLVFVASLPAAVVGITLHKLGFDELLFSHPLVAGAGLIITGVILRYLPGKFEQTREISDMNFFDALFIGLAQCVAIIPGISRSGSTVCSALRLKIKREDAAEFSFLMAIPVIAGATFLEVLPLFKEGNSKSILSDFAPLIIGFVVAAVVGYAALKLMIEAVKKVLFSKYSVYCFCLSAIIIIHQLFKLFKS